LPNGKINLVENYDPNLGGPIVYYYWSNHYNHSSYNNLVISGLCGIRPSASDTLDLNPLIDESIKYFCLDDVQYHGHNLTVVYDADGTKYNVGKGLTVYVDHQKASLINNGKKYKVHIGKPIVKEVSKLPVNKALNILHKGYPLPTASINNNPDTSLFQANDGRTWYFTEITNRWTTQGSSSDEDWYAIDFGKPVELSSIKIYLVDDVENFGVPDKYTVDYFQNNQWQSVKENKRIPQQPIGNTVNTIEFDKLSTNQIRIHFKHSKKQVAVSEVECY
jgi:hypothetical protein